MTVGELYDAIGGNYLDARTRLMNDKIVTKFIMKYPSDPSYKLLLGAWTSQNENQIFRASHTLKGVCANLSLDRLFKTSSAICEAYRPGQEDTREAADVPHLIEVLKKDYDETVEKITEFATEH